MCSKRRGFMKFANLLIASAACVGLTGLASEAHAATNFYLYLDCHSATNVPTSTWADTSATVYAEIGYTAVSRDITWDATYTMSWSQATKQCAYENSMQGSFSSTNLPNWNYGTLNYVRVWMNTTSNGLWLDKVILKNTTAGTSVQWGSDDTIGYCVSGTVGSYGANCASAGTYDSWKFQL